MRTLSKAGRISTRKAVDPSGAAIPANALAGGAHPIVILPASMGPAGKEVSSRIKVEEDEHVWELNQKGPW